jgi:hypothetical protein
MVWTSREGSALRDRSQSPQESQDDHSAAAAMGLLRLNLASFVQSAADPRESWDNCWDGPRRLARRVFGALATREFSGASWNRTSDLSIISAAL